MTYHLTHRALIIGGSSGMGFETAKQLLKHKLTVTIVGNNRDKLEQAHSELSSYGEVKARQVDLYNPSVVTEFIKELDACSEPIGYLVNAAGYFNPKPFIEHSEQDYDRYHALNRATFMITQAVARNMIKHQFGRIVNIGSMWAKQASWVTGAIWDVDGGVIAGRN